MIRSDKKQLTKLAVPYCQATGCFELADVYVVLKEVEEVGSYDEMASETGYEKESKDFAGTGFDGFKLILYLCKRHDNDFHYLLNGSELQISKRCYLGFNAFQPSKR